MKHMAVSCPSSGRTLLCNKMLYFLGIFIVALSCQTAGEVCQFSYKNQPEDFNNATIIVPDNIVAMSDDVYVGTPKDSVVSTISKPTIVFIIDHSGSMYKNNPKDIMGNRFNVTRDLIDTLVKKHPNAEVGIVVFASNLYFNIDDDQDVFATSSTQNTGAYIPLHQLDKKYNGRFGHEILKKYLETDTVTQGFNRYVDLKHKPTGWTNDNNQTRTNITAGFDAAIHAAKSSNYPKSNHFIIFLSDGEATFPQNDNTEKNRFIEGIDVPTTFTVFLTNLSTPPRVLTTMTQNIRNNGYSTTNPKSNLWAFRNTDYRSLLNFIMENVMSQITSSILNTPTKITVNNKTATTWNNKHFSFDARFPLEGQKTDFNYTITYHVEQDTVDEHGEEKTVEKDKTEKINFTVKIDENAKPLANTFIVECWDRTIEFYHNKRKITEANELTRKIELRFIEKKIDILYGYKNVTVELSSKKTGDKEKLKLDLTGNDFSKEFLTKCGSDANSGNGVLQLKEIDTIYAFFKNNNLPLDTFTVTLPYSYNEFEFSLKPKATSPINLENLKVNIGPTIPESIRRILKKDNQDEFLSIGSGMLLQVVPFNKKTDNILNSELELIGTVSIVDPLGNTIIENREMGFHNESKSLNFLWDCKNLQKRYVDSGSYLALFKISSKSKTGTDVVNTYEPMKLLIGIQK